MAVVLPMDWYYSKDNTQHGPVALEELQAKLRTGEVSAEALVWRDGMGDWAAASTVPGLVVTRPVSLQDSPATVYTPPGAPMPGRYPPIANARPTSGLAICSLIFGVLGLTACFFPGIVAVICGHLAMGPTDPQTGNQSGRGLAVAGLVLGYFNVAMLALFALFVVLAGVTS